MIKKFGDHINKKSNNKPVTENSIEKEKINEDILIDIDTKDYHFLKFLNEDQISNFFKLDKPEQKIVIAYIKNKSYFTTKDVVDLIKDSIDVDIDTPVAEINEYIKEEVEPVKIEEPIKEIEKENSIIKEVKKEVFKEKDIIKESDDNIDDFLYKLYNDVAETFKCEIHIEGASLENSKVRLLIETDEWNFYLKGNIDKEGNVSVPIKKLYILPENTKGVIKLEVIADDTVFYPWKQNFIIKTSKKVKVANVQFVRDKK